ncbi:DUF423 domain-containing protein [Lysobacter brunescens]|uniref:DUF423 domain-containing protein n=1 Tax=Lysobacter brunescens TaxID=262323 RepID=A0ABW2YG19_9GAMM
MTSDSTAEATSGALRRLLTASGAVFASAGVVLSAYAAHAAEIAARASLQSAALFALLHGVALAALSRHAARRTGLVALFMLALGTLLFSGTLVAAHAFGMPTRPAPFGGMLLILGWLLFAIDAMRR